MSQKFLTFRLADIRRYLSPEQKTALMDLWKTIETKRKEENKATDEPLFTLNLIDKYAQPAIDAYISAIQADPSNLQSSGNGVEAALRAAQDIRHKGLMTGEPRLPTVA